MEKIHQTDIVIVGAGPVGLFAVFQCGMLKMKCHVIDSLEQAGGQCQALYPEKPIFDIPAWPEISGAGLIAQLERQAAPFAPVYHLNQQATALEKTAEGMIVTTSTGNRIHCKAVILAAGAGAFGPNKPPLAGLEDYEGTSVFYLVKRREDFKGKRLVIAGGGDSAVDWAISLADVAEKIFFVHRRDKFRAAPESISRLHDLASAGKIDMVIPYQLSALKGENGKLLAVTVEDLDGRQRTLEADILLPFFGMTPQLGAIADFGVTVTQHHIPVAPHTCETNIAGVFAIGDCAAYEGKLKLILTGFAEAATAAHAAHPLVFPGEALHFVYSTSKGVP